MGGGELDPTAEALVGWVKESGGAVHEAVAYERSPAFGFGLCAAAPVEEGEALVLLPEKCTLRVSKSESARARDCSLSVCVCVRSFRGGGLVSVGDAHGASSAYHAIFLD